MTEQELQKQYQIIHDAVILALQSIGDDYKKMSWFYSNWKHRK